VELVLRETGCEAGKWFKLDQAHGQWQISVLAGLNLRLLVPHYKF
jgi:hypothetical protein